MQMTVLKSASAAAGKTVLRFLMLTGAYFLIELFSFALLAPEETSCLIFGILWAVLLTSLVMLLPRTAGRIGFGITYYLFLGWTMGQTGYYRIFNRMMWLTDVGYAGEGADFLGDVLSMFPPLWWWGGAALILLGALLIWRFPKTPAQLLQRTPFAAVAVAAVVVLNLYPEVIFQKDRDIWGTNSEYARSSSYKVTYDTMYDAKKVYDISGIYHTTVRDIWQHLIYPMTPAYRAELSAQRGEVDAYFDARGESGANEMTGLLEGKNVIMVLMESMDDWMITQEDTPTLVRLMEEGINFTNFYTPGYGTARTINSEFCINSGIYLPTNGRYVFDYVTNDFDQSIASQLVHNGFTAEIFHYNAPDFYSRGAFEPALGYNAYNCYADYVTDEKLLFDDELLFDIEELNDLFFREGQTFNTIITRSAHLSYKYNEVLSHWALKKYPEYRRKYASEEEDCARLKAKLVDNMFARLLEELEAHGQLENTVIIGVTDHYTYGYKNMEELYAHSGVSDDLLLEKTPCFIWTADGPAMEVDKTLNTADLVPTVLNLLGVDSPHRYLGQDAFDPDYEGYALFPNGSWISDGVACRVSTSGEVDIIMNEKNKVLADEYLQDMSLKVQDFIHISNLLLTSDYYRTK